MIEINMKIIDSLTHQLSDTLKAMGKTKNLEEKLTYSQIVKNLSESLEVFLMRMDDDMMDYDFEED